MAGSRSGQLHTSAFGLRGRPCCVAGRAAYDLRPANPPLQPPRPACCSAKLQAPPLALGSCVGIIDRPACQQAQRGCVHVAKVGHAQVAFVALDNSACAN